MGEHNQARGRLTGMPLRVAAVFGVACVAGLSLTMPASAEDELVEGTPCTASARACVDLLKQKAWLIDQDGKVTLGPVSITSGGPGKETPAGSFNVQWKDKAHKSQEFKLPSGQGAPMPYSVFFADGGVAFHGGSLRRASAGCVHLSDADSQTFYSTLQLGDEVQVHAKEPAAPKPAPKPEHTTDPSPAPAEDAPDLSRYDNFDDDRSANQNADQNAEHSADESDSAEPGNRRADRRGDERRSNQAARADEEKKSQPPNPAAGAQTVGGLMSGAYGQHQ